MVHLTGVVSNPQFPIVIIYRYFLTPRQFTDNIFHSKKINVFRGGNPDTTQDLPRACRLQLML